jgi:hypothetical protein
MQMSRAVVAVEKNGEISGATTKGWRRTWGINRRVEDSIAYRIKRRHYSKAKSGITWKIYYSADVSPLAASLPTEPISHILSRSLSQYPSVTLSLAFSIISHTSTYSAFARMLSNP